jgi:hypothetical protein
MKIDAQAQSVITHVDTVAYEGEQPFVLGWACQPGNKTSVDVRIYADAPNGPVAVGAQMSRAIPALAMPGATMRGSIALSCPCPVRCS